MLRYILALNLFFVSIISSAQLSIVYDKDGFVNLREKPSIKSKIIGKIIEGQVFSISPFDDESPNSEWVKVWLPINPDPKINDFIKYKDINEDGYIHRSRIVSLEELIELKIVDNNPKKVSLKNDHLQVTIETKAFEKSQHNISKNKEGTMSIDDDSHYWGFKDQIPKSEIKSIKIINDGINYNFPKTSIFGLYELNLEFTKVHIGQSNEIYLEMSGADGSESYEVVWCLKNNKIFSMTVMQIIP